MNKELPKNIEAEKCLLGSMFWSRESLHRGCVILVRGGF